jgi:hypothetical protein
MEAIMRKNNSLIVGVAFATAMLAGAVIPIGAQAAVIDVTTSGINTDGCPATFGCVNEEFFNVIFNGPSAASLTRIIIDLRAGGDTDAVFNGINNTPQFEVGTGLASTTTATSTLAQNDLGLLIVDFTGFLATENQHFGQDVDNLNIFGAAGGQSATDYGTTSVGARAFLSDGSVYAGVFVVTGSTSLAELTQVTPVPAALPLFGSGLGILGLLGWRRKRKNAAARAAA